jgi:pimeloyl-ACP methyl ester carboxylesterase
MVGHSYGGGISLVTASQDVRVRGVVLLDAVVPRTYGNGELEKNLATKVNARAQSTA